jgi:hypothetical protein
MLKITTIVRYHRMLKSIPALLLVIGLLPSIALAENEVVGEIMLSRGAVTSTQKGEVRFLNKGEALYEGDVLNTGAKSFAVLKLKDEGKITLRPGTTFGIEKFEHGQGKESGIFSLLRGGLRAITGLVNKRNPKGLRIHTPVSTIGIRGTDFDARLCADRECNDKARTDDKEASIARLGLVARVHYQRGSMHAEDGKGKKRVLTKGGSVYKGDIINTGAGTLAVLVFRDDTRVTLKANTRFKVENYQFDQQAGQQNSVLFRLLKGGMRTLTGLIGKRSPKDFRVGLPVATIGIRGTGFDAQTCETNCAELANGMSGVANTDKYGTYVVVWDKQVVLHLPDPPKGPGGEMVLGKNDPVFIPSDGRPPIHLPATPPTMQQDPQYRPDKLEIDLDNLFRTQPLAGSPSGLYVTVYDGHVVLTNKAGQVDLGIGEAGYVESEDSQPIRLDGQPAFQTQDPLPRPGDLNETTQRTLEFMIDEIAGASRTEPGSPNAAECAIQ